MIYQNPILNTDAYKFTHWKEYPSGLVKLYSYAEARKGGRFDQTLFFGLQMVIHDHLLIEITDSMIDEAEKVATMTFGTNSYFNRQVWERVRDLGYWPVKIKALPEGSLVDTGNVLFTLESTEDWFATTLNHLETILMHVWYPTTIATNDFYIKKGIRPFFEKTGSLENIPFAVNDFGLRGVTSLDAGERGGAAHLLNFRGSDNLAASLAVEKIYHEAGRAQSIWATEHSVATMYGQGQGEIDYLASQLERADDDSTLSIVIDSYDAHNFVKKVVGNPTIMEKIKKRIGRLVLRPDSGDPIETPLEIIDELDNIFGHSVNDKGYKILNDNIGIIQGDGMNRQTIIELYQKLTDQGWSADNLVVGSGGGLLQEGFTRDTERFAIKASYAEMIDGKTINIQKKPKTDSSKASKTGRFKVIKEDGSFKTIPQDQDGEDLLRVIYEDGNYYPEDFSTLLERVDEAFNLEE